MILKWETCIKNISWSGNSYNFFLEYWLTISFVFFSDVLLSVIVWRPLEVVTDVLETVDLKTFQSNKYSTAMTVSEDNHVIFSWHQVKLLLKGRYYDWIPKHVTIAFTHESKYGTVIMNKEHIEYLWATNLSTSLSKYLIRNDNNQEFIFLISLCRAKYLKI